MHRRIWKLMIAMLVFALLIGTVPAMAAEEEGGLSLFGGMGDGANGLSAPTESAEPAGELIALDELGISVQASGYTSVRQEEDECVYFYAMSDGSIPYVMLKKYDFTADDFTDQFTEYMSSCYSDLRVAGTGTSTFGDKEYEMIAYNYSINGYFTYDRRLFLELDGSTYMIATKETPELGLSLPDGFLGPIADSMELMTDGDYPLHVDSTRSIEPSLGGPVLPVEDTPSSGTGTTPVGSSGGSVGSVLNTPEQSGYDGVVTFEPSMAGYAGTWVEFEDGFKLYLPSDWSEYELSDEERAGGSLYSAFDASYSNGMAQVLVNWTADTTVHSIDDLKLTLGQLDDISMEDTLLINGIPCATYTTGDGTVRGLTFFHPLQGEPYVFNIMVGDCSENEDICNAVLCSLSLAG